MSKGNVDLAIRLLSNSMEVGVLALNKETIDLLKVKHPVEKGASEDTKLHGRLPTVENIISDVIDDSVFSGDGENYSRSLWTIGIDTNGWRRILVLGDYGDASNDLRKAIASLIKKICIEEIDDSSLLSLMASRLVPLNKNPGLRPIGVG